MKIRLMEKNGLTRELHRLYPEYFSFTGGTPCRFRKSENEGYHAVYRCGGVELRYHDKGDLLLALGDLALLAGPRSLKKNPPFTFRGIMLDVSRNGVPTVAFLKDRVARLALMGLNYFCLYAEDTYEVAGEPLFGYGRGRYSKAEIRELVRYVGLFGVTLFPCIQTLGHMEQLLQYQQYADIADNHHVYNVYGKRTYPFIEKTLREAMAPFKTRLIHIGLDETYGLGRGHAFKENTPVNPRRIYLTHLKKVAAICRRLGLKPMMWGDIVLGAAVGGLEKGFSRRESAGLPRDVKMVYWDYYSRDPRKYGRIIRAYRKMGFNPLVAPGVWSWSRFFSGYDKAAHNIRHFMAGARKHGVREALNTQWGDDGHECFFDYTLTAHALFLAHATEKTGQEKTAREKFRAFFKEDFDAFNIPAALDHLGAGRTNHSPPNYAKCFLYDDPALGFMSGAPFVKNADRKYAAVARRLRPLSARPGAFRPLYRMAFLTAAILTVKCGLRQKLVARYKRGDRKGLRALLRDVLSARRMAADFRKIYRQYWLTERKPFGYEVVDARLGGLEARLDYLHWLVLSYLKGRLKNIPELEFRPVKFADPPLPYRKIATRCFSRF